MTYSDDEKQTVMLLRDKGVSWKSISTAVGRPVGALRTWFYRNRVNFGLPRKVKAMKKLTDGRVGLLIKRLVDETPKIPIRELQFSLQSSLGPTTPCPSTTTIHKFLMLNDLKIVKLLKKRLISMRNIEKRIRFATENLENIDRLVNETIWSDETIVRSLPKSQEIIYRCQTSNKKRICTIIIRFNVAGAADK